MRLDKDVAPGRSGARPTPLHAALPAGARRGVVVLHEIFGIQPEMERVAERFAAAGYAVALPDLFAYGPKPICIARAMVAGARGEGEQVEQIRAARDWLCERAGLTPERVGVIGFCLGGGFALVAGKGFGAVSVNYGHVPKTRLMKGLPPVIACYGGLDRTLGYAPRKLERALTQLGIRHEVHTYPTAGHSFITDGHHPLAAALTRPLLRVRYDADAAEDAWKRIFGFFDAELR